MAGTRTVYRGAHGRFAGSSGGKPEKVRAGGFAHAGFQARFQASRASRTASRPPSPARTSQKASSRKSFGLGGAAKRLAPKVVGIGVTAGVGLAAAHVVTGGGLARGPVGIRVTRSKSGNLHVSVSGSRIKR